MQEYYSVEVLNIIRMTSRFKNMFDKEAKRDFVLRFQEISRKLKEQKRIVHQLEKQTDKYWYAESEKAKYQFGLEITISHYRDFSAPKGILQKDIELNRVRNTKDKLMEKLKKSTLNIKKYHSLLIKEANTRLEIKMLAETLHSDILIKLQEKTTLTDSSCPRRFCVSNDKLVEKYLSRYQLAVPKLFQVLAANDSIVKNTL